MPASLQADGCWISWDPSLINRGVRGDLGQIFTVTVVLCLCMHSKHRRGRVYMAL